MSAHPTAREKHLEHESTRSEAARTLRALVRDGERARLLAEEFAAGRLRALLSVPEPIEDPDFPGCVW